MRGKCKVLVVGVLISLLVGCGEGRAGLIPPKTLDPAEEQAIRQAIKDGYLVGLPDFGSKAVPVLITRVFEVYDSRPGRQDPAWIEASDCIVVLGRIGDPSAVPALMHLVEHTQYRPTRSMAAQALADIGDRRAIDSLWRAFREEKGYLDKGDTKGPDRGWGLAMNFTVGVVGDLGHALERFGENVGDYPRRPGR